MQVPTLKAASKEAAIEKVQNNYVTGFEPMFNNIPILVTGDGMLNEKISFSKLILESIAQVIKMQPLARPLLHGGSIETHVLAVEKEGTAILSLTKLGSSRSIHAHVHEPGFHYEQLVSGDAIITFYFKDKFGKIRARKSELRNEREHTLDGVMHSITPVTACSILQFSSDYSNINTRLKVLNFKTTTQMSKAALINGSQIEEGDVALVRDIDSPFGDHYIVNLKDEKVRILAPDVKSMLDSYGKPKVMLKLNPVFTGKFLRFHGYSK